jgi:hypothetical protein
MISNLRVFEDGTISTKTVLEQNMEEQERQRGLCSLDLPALTTFEINQLLERDVRAATPGKSYRKLQTLHWQEAPELPHYASDIPSPKLDILFAHQNRVLRDDVAGYFCGQPIVDLDELGMEVDQMRDTINRIASSSGTSIPAEVMPGEMICADNVIRRTTTREVTGEQHSILTDRLAKWCPKGQDVDDAGEPIESPVELLCVNIDEARQASKEGKIVKWRTAGELSEVIA